MLEEHLVVQGKKRRSYSSYLGEISPAVPNLLERDFHAEKPNEKWLTDITEFHIPAGKVYLSPLVDCFDGMAVSWTIGTSPDAELVNTMLDGAIACLSPGEHPVIHTDRGCHYRWPGWIARMETAGLTRSMSRKGCSPDNAACEGFFGTLKSEMFYTRSWEGVSLEEFIYELDGFLRWYNEERIKISLDAMSPIEYRRSLGLAAQSSPKKRPHPRFLQKHLPFTIIGPRPERPIFVVQFNEEIPGFIERLRVKPGITGWAQVNGGYDISTKEKLDLDMYYINHQSIFLDMKILFKTIKIIFTGEGAR